MRNVLKLQGNGIWTLTINELIYEILELLASLSQEWCFHGYKVTDFMSLHFPYPIRKVALYEE